MEYFGLIIEGEELLPYIKPGETAYFEKTALLRDGEVGVFSAGGDMLIRQYCEDSFGTVYLFAVNRQMRSLDRSFSRGSEITCYGRLIMQEIPLP
ncbi:MAG: hypothetical protein II881_02080 [Oscillospiraceae bacterium]|nr:hypothetical protein [Oscillospiraceae bacterium]